LPSAIGIRTEQFNMNTETEELQKQIEFLTIQRDALTAKVSRMLREFQAIDKEADNMEEDEPETHQLAGIGKVVSLLQYRKAQLISAKSRTSLSVQVEGLKQKLKEKNQDA